MLHGTCVGIKVARRLALTAVLQQKVITQCLLGKHMQLDNLQCAILMDQQLFCSFLMQETCAQQPRMYPSCTDRAFDDMQSKAVAEHVGVLLDADEKFLIFSHHTDMHNAVEAAVRG